MLLITIFSRFPPIRLPTGLQPNCLHGLHRPAFCFSFFVIFLVDTCAICSGLNFHWESITDHIFCTISYPDTSCSFVTLFYRSLHILTPAMLVQTHLWSITSAMGFLAFCSSGLASAAVWVSSLTAAQCRCFLNTDLAWVMHLYRVLIEISLLLLLLQLVLPMWWISIYMIMDIWISQWAIVEWLRQRIVTWMTRVPFLLRLVWLWHGVVLTIKRLQLQILAVPLPLSPCCVI